MAEQVLQDQGARDVIRNALDRNVVVLAGAGAGKTHELIQRMVNCVRTGPVEVERMAAITFTRKAAGEMRGRFFLKLRELADSAAGAEGDRIRRSLGKIDQCFIGTIHSFCGRLLRERPVEAGLAPDFTEIEEREETVLRRDLWHRFVQQRLRAEDHRLGDLEELGLRLEDVYPFFQRRCRFSDLPLKETRVDAPDLEPVVEQAVRLLGEARLQIPDELARGPDPFMQKLTRAEHFLRFREMDAPSAHVAFLSLLPAEGDVKVTYWGVKRPYATELRDELLPDFRTRVLGPALTAWRQYVYRHVTAFVDDAMGFCDEERGRTGKLTFQDLLQRAAALLRDHAGVRAHFGNRYACLFVDEFQDTDPIQAEMLAYLVGQDRAETDWRRLVPRPGSLFLVGDDKQSIYRFRRADMETFRLVRDWIARTGGEVVELCTSFRSLGRLCDWINPAFSALLPARQEEYQAGFSPLLRFRPDGGDATCVRRLSLAAVKGHRRAEIAQMDAGRIADFIAAALAGTTEFNGAGANAILKERAAAGDFLILTRTTGQLATYARALEERGLPFDIVGGERLGQAVEVRAVMDVLEAVYAPENPIPLLGYLRGPLVGLGDDELYAFRRAGGLFEYTRALPAGLSDELRARLRDAFGRLARTARWMLTRAPAPAFELMLADLGLAAFSATRPMGSTRAGNLLRLQALVRLWEDQGMHWGRILEEMRELIADPDYRVEEMTLEAGQEDVVRLMNLHQVKGLEGKVVFLADPGDASAESRLSRQGPEFHAARRGAEPFLSLPVRRPRGPHHSEIIAEPQGWPDDAERETQFLRAEALRLLYVAATRARNLLVVSCYDGKPDRGPWAALGPHLQAVPELAVPALAKAESEPVPLPSRPLDWEEGRRERREHWQRVRRPTYSRSSVTDEAHDDGIEFSAGDGWGTEYGSVVHRLFSVAVDGGMPRDEAAYIRFLIQRAGLDEALAGPAQEALRDFRGSQIWDEVQQADAALSEVPFAASEQADGGPRVVRGVVDLAYRLPGGWKIVDYKTNRAETDEELEALVDRYTPQISAYARHWQDLTGDPVLETGLWFTTSGRWWGLAD